LSWSTQLRKELRALMSAIPMVCIPLFIAGLHRSFSYQADIKPILDRLKESVKSLRAIDVAQPIPGSGGAGHQGAATSDLRKATVAANDQAAMAFKRPVPVSKAATTMNKRGSSVLRKLKASGRRVDDTQRPAVAELDDVCQCFPRYKKRLTAWGDKEYPVAEG